MDGIWLAILAWLFGSPGGTSPTPNPNPNPVPPTFPGPAPVPIPVPGPNKPPGVPAPASTYTIKSGDTGVGLAKRATGDSNRWREILKANPTYKAVTAPSPTTGLPTTQIVPWNIGQVMNVPPGWNLSG